MINFPSLHLNSEYSLLESTIKIDSLINFAKENNLKQLVITDHNVMSGVGSFLYKCKKNNIKPIIGLDLDVENYRLILLAKNFKGYQHLSQLSSKKIRNNDISLAEIDTKNIFVIDHPTLGYFAKTKKQLKIDNYFVGTTVEKFSNAVWVQETKILKLDDNKALQILESIKNSGEMPKHNFNFKPYMFQAEKDSRVEQVFKIIEQCNVVFPEDDSILPKFPTINNNSSEEYFKKIVKENAKKILYDKKNLDEYSKRIKYEVSIIEELGFTDYFLIIWDLITWAKKRNIYIGPGRGSAAGSLVSYLLGITEVDPIQFGLLFERFLNPERVSMPDIDIDIQDDRREEVIAYLFEKYGKNNVAFISTFQRLGSKMALRDCGRALKIPLRDVDELSKMIPLNTSLSNAYLKSARFRAKIDNSNLFTELFERAKLIEGLPRQYGTHAAGIVISDLKIINKVATMNAYNDYNQVQFTMSHLEAHKLLKIDLLGLRNLSILQKIEEKIWDKYKRKIDLTKISYDDNLTNQLLSRGDTNGIFQLESPGMRRTVSKVGVSSLDDIVAIISLYRPGPMENIQVYADRKEGKVGIEKVSPGYDEIVKSTYGIIIYQEQIMKISQIFAGMSFGEADILRRAISKKNNELIQSLKGKFFEGAIKKKHKQETIEKVFNLIEKFANYGFNKSHAVAYGILAYRLAFLKARFPFEFYSALLESSIGSQVTLKKYIDEAKAKNISIISPNINLSMGKVVNNDKKIILPLTTIKGFGDAANTKFLEERNKGEFSDFFDLVSRLLNVGIGESIITMLIQSNSVRDFGNIQTLLDSLPLAIRYKNMITIEKDGSKTIDPDIIPKPKLISKKTKFEDELEYEKQFFGMRLNAFKSRKYENSIKFANLEHNVSEIIVFEIESIKKFKDKNGNWMGRAIVIDSTMKIDLTIFHEIFNMIDDVELTTILKGEVKKTILGGITMYSLVKPWKEISDE